MSHIKIIKTACDHNDAIARVSQLFEKDTLSQQESDELDVIGLLIEKYESEAFPLENPDPIDMIEFRMDQQGLSRKDLEPMIGNKSKVSQVLNRKLPLSLSMIRRLHTGLDISYECLHRDYRDISPEEQRTLSQYPYKQMLKNGYFAEYTDSLTDLKNRISEISAAYFAHPTTQLAHSPAMLRASKTAIHSQRQLDTFALHAWQAKVLIGKAHQTVASFYKENIDATWLKELIQLSTHEDFLNSVKGKLNEIGIYFVIEPHLPKTYLDGAAFMTPEGNPLIGMTLRYRRIDTFWFTLLHELGHIALHCNSKDDVFFDDLESASQSILEQEADNFARDNLIPPTAWEPDQLSCTADINALARQLKIHPNIIAGRLRKDSGNYKLFGRAFRENIL